VVGHERVTPDAFGVERGARAVADPQQFLHAVVLVVGELEAVEFGLAGEVVLVDLLVVEGARVDLVEFVAC
jgi:hypothetical protein